MHPARLKDRDGVFLFPPYDGHRGARLVFVSRLREAWDPQVGTRSRDGDRPPETAPTWCCGGWIHSIWTVHTIHAGTQEFEDCANEHGT